VSIQVSILGMVELASGHRHKELRGRQQRALLIALAVGENRLVPTESLIAELWGEDPPQQAPNALQAHISRLRRVLAKLDPGGGDRLRSVSSGYLLRLREHDVFDVRKFTSTVSALRSRRDISLEETSIRLRELFNMWRGPTFGGPVGGPICQAAAARLEETRLAALELYFDTELKLGHHAGIIAELSEALESDPLNERLCEQLMVALYRAGRQTDALSTYYRMRSRLDDDLGVEPSPTLRMFEQAILEHDSMLNVNGDYCKIRTLVA